MYPICNHLYTGTYCKWYIPVWSGACGTLGSWANVPTSITRCVHTFSAVPICLAMPYPCTHLFLSTNLWGHRGRWRTGRRVGRNLGGNGLAKSLGQRNGFMWERLSFSRRGHGNRLRLREIKRAREKRGCLSPDTLPGDCPWAGPPPHSVPLGGCTGHTQLFPQAGTWLIAPAPPGQWLSWHHTLWQASWKVNDLNHCLCCSVMWLTWCGITFLRYQNLHWSLVELHWHTVSMGILWWFQVHCVLMRAKINIDWTIGF